MVRAIAEAPLSQFKNANNYADGSHEELVDDAVICLLVYLWCTANWEAFISCLADSGGKVEIAEEQFPRYFDSIAYYLLP